MTLPGRVTSAPPGLHGIDTNEVLNEEHCRVAKSRGFSFCIRYVSRTARAISQRRKHERGACVSYWVPSRGQCVARSRRHKAFKFPLASSSIIAMHGLRRWLRQGSLPASMSARRRFLLEKRFSGVFKPNIFGDLEARFRTYPTR